MPRAEHTSSTVHLGRSDPSHRELRLTLVSGATLVEHGLTQLLAPFSDQVKVSSADVRGAWDTHPDVLLYDLATSSQGRWAAARGVPAAVLVLLGWDESWWETGHPDLLEADGLVAADLSGHELLVSLQAIASSAAAPHTHWPYRSHGLSRRESDVLLDIARGKSNEEVAASLYLSINSVKGYIRSCYGKIGVTGRTNAVLWAVQHRYD